MYFRNRPHSWSLDSVWESDTPVLLSDIPPESVIQNFWNTRRWPQEFTTEQGQQITVLHGGTLNRNAGPDFLNAIIQTGEHILSGDIEIHRQSSGWKAHGHAGDPRYKDVLLHVVCRMANEHPPGTPQPPHTVVLKNIPEQVKLPKSREACRNTPIDPEAMKRLQVMGIRRVQRKRARFAQSLLHGTSSEELWYRKTLRVLGYSPNKEIMEQISGRLPLELAREISLHYSPADKFEIALGLTGFHRYFDIPVPAWDDLHHRIGLWGMKYTDWKPLRSRPVNHPVLRLFLLLDRLPGWWETFRSMDTGMQSRTLLENLITHVDLPAGYDSHFSVGSASLGQSRAVEMLVNAWIPLSTAHPGKEMEGFFRDLPEIPVPKMTVESVSVYCHSAAGSRPPCNATMLPMVIVSL